jgi:tight adherence protein B
MPLLTAGLTFLLVVLVLAAALFLTTGGGRQELVRRRLEAIEKAQSRGNTTVELQLLRDEMLSDVPALHRALMHWSWTVALGRFMEQAGMKTKPGRLVLMSAVLCLGSGLLAKHTVLNPLITVLTGAVAGLVPFGVVVWKRYRRLREFEKNFPEAVDLLGRAIRSGHAINTGIEMIAKEIPEPVAGEFRVTFEEQNFGLPLKDSLLNLCERVPLIDVRFFVSALLVQKETGGNLAEILDTLSRVIRERFKIYGEIRIKTAQGRLTAGILIALPPAMMIALGILNPPYIQLLFTDPWGPYMLGVAATLQLIGSAILWKIVHIEV